MRASEFANSKLVIFDIDDTLVNTDTKVGVVRDGRTIKRLDSHDFTHYKLEPGEEFDFGAFRDAREFFANARPIAPMIRQLKQDIATGNRVIMVTARADFNDRDIFLSTFEKWGIDMSKVHVYRAGNIEMKVATEEKKKIILRHLLGKTHYDKVIMYDDAVPNLDAFLSLAQDYPWSKFYAWHVDREGGATEYHRSGITETIRKIGLNKWRLYSRDGSKNLGTFDSLAAAKKHEQEVQAFKHMDEQTINEIGDSPSEHEPNRRRRRSLFHATVDGQWVDVFFDRSDINGTLHITFTVNNNYEAPEQPTSASRSTIKILSTVLAIIRQRLPEYIKSARPPAVSFTAREDSRTRLYRKYFVPVVQAILGPKWTLDEYPTMGMTVFNWRPSKKHDVEENFADGRVKGKSRPGRVKRSGASCKGSVTDLRARAKKYGGERGKMYHWCANMKSGRKKTNEDLQDSMLSLDPWTFDQTDQGWRNLSQPRAIAVIKDYLGRYVRQGQFVNAPQGTKSLDPGTLYWHLGQLLAMSGAYDQAVSAMRSSLGTDTDWNDYVKATIAFLANNKKQFDQYVGRENSNKDTIDRLAASWGKSYKDAY